jgi:LysM repeat protein
MKGRTISLVIALVLLNYLIISTLWNVWSVHNTVLPTPTRTPRPTYTRSAQAMSFVTATYTPIPEPTQTPTPAPAAPSATPTATPVLPATAVLPTPTELPATATPAASPSPIAAATSFLHTVAAGEYLSYIAERYGVSVDDIVKANGLKSADAVYIGQRLIIPAKGPTPTPAPSVTRRTHLVKAGEYLSLIAQKYGVSVDAIVKANGLKNADAIYAGQVLIIP